MDSNGSQDKSVRTTFDLHLFIVFCVVYPELGHQTVAGNRLYLTRIYVPDGADVSVSCPRNNNYVAIPHVQV